MAWQPHFLFGTPNCSFLSNQQSQTGLNHIGLVSLTDIVRYAVRMLTQNILGSTGYLRERRNPARLGGSLFCPGARAHSAHALFLPSLWLNSSFRGKFDYYSQRKFALFVLIPLFSPLLCPPPFIASGLADYDTDTAGPGHLHSTLCCLVAALKGAPLWSTARANTIQATSCPVPRNSRCCSSRL